MIRGALAGPTWVPGCLKACLLAGLGIVAAVASQDEIAAGDIDTMACLVWKEHCILSRPTDERHGDIFNEQTTD